jgi:hypothetical protein
MISLSGTTVAGSNEKFQKDFQDMLHLLWMLQKMIYYLFKDLAIGTFMF